MEGRVHSAIATLPLIASLLNPSAQYRKYRVNYHPAVGSNFSFVELTSWMVLAFISLSQRPSKIFCNCNAFDSKDYTCSVNCVDDLGSSTILSMIFKVEKKEEK
jgi:hypothetical protein